MTAHLTNGAANGVSDGTYSGVSLQELPKSHTFTLNLPPDPEFKTPSVSHRAPRGDLGPRMVKGALFTYVRPEETKTPELLGISRTALHNIGLKDGVENTEDFKNVVAGNKIYWDDKTEEGIYPWAQCYGGWQFGSWAGQLGDGRAISLFESTNPSTKTRYEIQLKGAGRTPYSRFADGKAVLRSSIREFVVSEALNGLHIPTTRALALTLAPESTVRRERPEPGAIVARFAYVSPESIYSFLRRGLETCLSRLDFPHYMGNTDSEVIMQRILAPDRYLRYNARSRGSKACPHSRELRR